MQSDRERGVQYNTGSELLLSLLLLQLFGFFRCFVLSRWGQGGDSLEHEGDIHGGRRAKAKGRNGPAEPKESTNEAWAHGTGETTERTEGSHRLALKADNSMNSLMFHLLLKHYY